MEAIHIGDIIKKKVEEKGMTIMDFADALHCSRNNVYSIFSRKTIDFQLLLKIAEILGWDLLAEYYPNDHFRHKYITLIEIDDLKMKEIQSDSQITILHSCYI